MYLREVSAGYDAFSFEEVVQKLAPLFGSNPRRLNNLLTFFASGL
jgi:hypothetical protein